MTDNQRSEGTPTPVDEAAFTVPVIEEQVEVSTRTVETGRVRLATEEHAERREVEAELSSEWVEVERLPRDELMDEPPQPHFEGDTLVLPVAEEEIVIESRWRLREEVRVRQQRGAHRETVPIELRRRDVVVERRTISEQNEKDDGGNE